MSSASERNRIAFLRACTLDVAVRKPGNVSLDAPGHRMTARQFLDSAAVAAPELCRPGAAVGERIEAAMRATWAAVGCNTNLGILLLCAPLAVAAERLPAQPGLAAMRAALNEVLAMLDVADAEAAFRAIAQANPGGLGDAPQQDVRRAPSVTLRAAMGLAAERDRIAWQYASGAADLFDVGWPALRAAHRDLLEMPPDGAPSAMLRQAVLRVFLGMLSRFPDSHIVRKHGAALAQTVMRDAARHAAAPADAPALDAWDNALKTAGVNPGTSADLTVASLMLGGLLGPD